MRQHHRRGGADTVRYVMMLGYPASPVAQHLDVAARQFGLTPPPRRGRVLAVSRDCSSRLSLQCRAAVRYLQDTSGLTANLTPITRIFAMESMISIPVGRPGLKISSPPPNSHFSRSAPVHKSPKIPYFLAFLFPLIPSGGTQD